jgi:hypothetical protein
MSCRLKCGRIEGVTDAVSDTASSLPGFHILVPVWGTAYCDLFTQVSLPSQLAPGNLPCLPHKERCLYHVITRPEDIARIERSQAWQRLRSLMPVRIDLRTDRQPSSYETMSAYLRDAIAFADDSNAASLFFNADLVFADGAGRTLIRCVQTGRRVVFTTGIRLLKETVVPQIRQAGLDGLTISLTPQALAAIAMRNLHPLTRQNIWNQPGTFVPATILWQVADEGLLARCFHLHPLLVWPERKHVHFRGTVDDDFVAAACPRSETDYVVTDSDELLMCEISAASPPLDARSNKGKIDDVANWAESNTDERHRLLAKFPIRIHAGAMTEPLWSAAEHDSSLVIDAALKDLRRSAPSIFLRSPMRLFRRWVRRADARVQARQNFQGDVGGHAGFPAGYLAFYRRYSAFCAGYERFRSWLDGLLFGPQEAPYPWSGRWFTSRMPARAALALLPEGSERSLVIAPPHIGHLLTSGMANAELMDSLPPWAVGSGSFDLVVCAGLPEAGNARIAELARVLAPGGHAIVASGVSGVDCRAYQEATSAFAIERRVGVGGPGTALALRFHRWSDAWRRAHRLSPVVLEIPILPAILLARLFAGCAIALAGAAGDLLDVGRKHPAFIVTLLARRT